MGLETEDKRILCATAREALARALHGRPYEPPQPPADRPALLEKCGCFVTLRTRGALRGCLGCFTSAQPLYQTVPAYARHSALDDPRFGHHRLAAADLDAVTMEISVLSPLAACPDPEAITLGVHGIYVQREGRSGCFLPQVAGETGWSLEEFWGHCCRDKAGLDYDAWRDPRTGRYTFTADIFDCGD